LDDIESNQISAAPPNPHNVSLKGTRHSPFARNCSLAQGKQKTTLLIELVAQFIETDHATQKDPEWGGVPLRGGTTIIVGIDGTVRYVIAKPLPNRNAVASEDQNLAMAPIELQRRELNTAAVVRRSEQLAHIGNLDRSDPQMPYFSPEEYRIRMKARMSLRALHEGAQG
jgi:hypothetical protein